MEKSSFEGPHLPNFSVIIACKVRILQEASGWEPSTPQNLVAFRHSAAVQCTKRGPSEELRSSIETFCEDSGDVGLPQLGAAQSLKPQRVENGSRGIVAALRLLIQGIHTQNTSKYQNLKVRRATDNKSEYSRKAPSVRVLKTHCRDPQSQMQKAAQINANHGKATRRLTLFCTARQHKHCTFVKLLETTFGLDLQMFLAYIFSHGNDRLIDMTRRFKSLANK